jgi:hypothetical protein
MVVNGGAASGQTNQLHHWRLIDVFVGYASDGFDRAVKPLPTGEHALWFWCQKA